MKNNALILLLCLLLGITSLSLIFSLAYINFVVMAQLPQYTFVRYWGIGGPNPLNDPTSIAIDGDGSLYVLDSGRHRVQKFASNGTLLLEWGSQGPGSDQFEFPSGIAVDSSGNVYVVDSGNHKIKKFTSEGNSINEWSIQGSADAQTRTPSGIDIDSSGTIYVANTTGHNILKFTTDGIFIKSWGKNGQGEGEFSSPTGIAIDPSGDIYVADTDNHRIQKFSNEGEPLDFGVKGRQQGSGDGRQQGSGDGQFRSPVGIGIDGNGNIYVADTGNNRIQKFDNDGNFITKWGVKGSGNNQFNSPTDAAIDNLGNVYVTDQDNNRIIVFATPTPPNNSPIAQNKTVETEEDKAIDITLTATDADSDRLSFSVVNQPSKGTLSGIDQSTGKLTYRPQADFNGTDKFEFRVEDGKQTNSSSNLATVFITVKAVNNPPVSNAGPDKTVIENTTVTLNGSGVDANSGNGLHYLWKQVSGQRKIALINGSSTTPSFKAPMVDNDTQFVFNLTVTDNEGAVSMPDGVNITVRNANHPPVAHDKNVVMDENTSVNIYLKGSDEDSGQTLKFNIESEPVNGRLSNLDSSSGIVSYTPNPSHIGKDSFTYKVNDGRLDSNVATVSIIINEVNDTIVPRTPPANANISIYDQTNQSIDEFQSFNAGNTSELTNHPPVAHDKNVVMDENTSVNIYLKGSDEDSGQTLKFNIESEPVNGRLSNLDSSSGIVSYTPNPSHIGKDSFTYKVNDGRLDSNVATVSILVEAASP